MIVLVTVLTLALAIAGTYAAAIILATWRFARRCAANATSAAAADRIGVSILVPAEGAEPSLFENLAAYCRLEHRGPVQIVVGSMDADDAALAIAGSAAARHPAADFTIVAGARSLGPNRKASILAALAAAARHPVVAAIDSDVRVPRDYLARTLPVLLRPGVGLVSCVYRAPTGSSLGSAYEALCVNTDFCPSVVLASTLGRRDIGLGASLLLRRTTLAKVGGFAALADHLADDHRLAEIVDAAGERVSLAPCVVESDPNPRTIVAALRHQLRWARTVRACAPWGYGANVVTHGTTFAAAALAAAPLVPGWTVRLAAAVLALRVAAAVTSTVALGARVDRSLALLPLRDLVATAIWCASFVGDGVEWRGRRFRVDPEGRLHPVVDAPRAAPALTIRRPEEAA